MEIINEGLFDIKRKEGIIVDVKKIRNTEELVPVFVFISDLKAPIISKAIKYVTDSPYNHSSIAFDSSLERMYSFDIKHDGPTLENINESFKDEAVFSLYAIYVTPKQYNKMVQLVKDLFIRTDTYYNLKGIVAKLFNKRATTDNRFFCSEFIAYIFKEAGLDLFNKEVDEIEPYDFATNKNFKFVYRGKVINYSPERIEGRI